MKENEEITNLERFELLIEDCKGHRELYGEFSVGEYDIEIMQHILSDYKRVLKENEILKEEKEQAWEEWNNLEQGSYETEQRLKRENEKLKNKLLDTLEEQKVIKEETPQYIKENYIPKDKIEEILDGTEITDFNSLVETFLKIKKLLESE